MKLFISHSWQDKTVAHRIAQAMGDGADVWLDVDHLRPGDSIQPRIDDALATRDVVIVVWSAAAAASDGVAAEIDTAARLKLRLLPVLIDDTPLKRQRRLAGLYGVAFDEHEPRAGLMRIQAAIARLMMGALGIEDARALNALTRFEGMHQYLAEYRNKRGIGGADSLQWATQAMQSCNEAYTEVGRLRDQVGDTLKVMQDTMAQLQAAGNDRPRIAAILDVLRRRPDAGSHEFKTLIGFVQGKLQSLGPDDTPTAVRKLRGNDYPDPTPAVDPQLELAERYIRMAPGVLQSFSRLARSGGSPALQAVAARLGQYLREGSDVVPDATHPVWGLADDAWLIHNTVYRCVEAGLFAADAIAVDWQAVIAGDAVVLRLLPGAARNQLEAGLVQLLQLIAAEQQGWQPGFVGQGWQSGTAAQAVMGAYAAFMGTGEAVSGETQATGTGTIDDVYYTVGGKAYFMTGR